MKKNDEDRSFDRSYERDIDKFDSNVMIAMELSMKKRNNLHWNYSIVQILGFLMNYSNDTFDHSIDNSIPSIKQQTGIQRYSLMKKNLHEN